MRNPPHPGLQGFDLVFSHAVQDMHQNLSRQILRIVPIVQPVMAKPKNRLYIGNDLLSVHMLFSFSKCCDLDSIFITCAPAHTVR